MTNEPKVCQECGVGLPEDSPQGLCPRCLLKRGLRSSESVVSGQLSAEETLRETEPRVAASPGLPRESQRFGDYQLVRLLGEGGMGVVYEAEHLPSERRVALKVLNHALDSREARERFLREGQLAASINHPNSIYIFGTEEINRIPVISMELAPGGTLTDRVKEKGPLPITEAVDVILQVIAGLEAAQAKGVLHRDIKPSNCFVDADGTVKVGDFGLSISTLATVETQLTATGRILGTPAFASPEQLRGDELDVRSDIYSVGVTLYYLLTGRVPFEETNLVKLLTMVVERPPESPAKLRREVHKQLAQVVLRCLAKLKENRFGTYPALRKALLPFSPKVAAADTWSRRSLADLIDAGVLACLIVFAGSLWVTLGQNRHEEFFGLYFIRLRLLQLAILIGYFTVLEGYWGSTFGKALCQIRVVDLAGGRPGIVAASIRALTYIGVSYMHCWLPLVTSDLRLVIDPSSELHKSLGNPLLLPAFYGLLFIGATRENWFTGLHDRWSRTRVVHKTASVLRPTNIAVEREVSVPESPKRVGPYCVLTRLVQGEVEEWLFGYDLVLRRKVWIRRLKDGATPIETNRRSLGRSGRLRWLNGRRTPGDCWDAYEAPTGAPLLALLSRPHPWRVVRRWSLDLAEELSAALKEKSIPALFELSQIWITAEGRLKLLEVPAPSIDPENNASVAREPSVESRATRSEAIEGLGISREAQLFLKQVTLAALEGRPVDAEEAKTTNANVPVALGVRRFLGAMPSADTFDSVVQQLRSLHQENAEISRLNRIGLVILCTLPIVIWNARLQYTAAKEHEFARQYPEFGHLLRCLVELEKPHGSPQKAGIQQQRQALEAYVRSLFTPPFILPEPAASVERATARYLLHPTSPTTLTIFTVLEPSGTLFPLAEFKGVLPPNVFQRWRNVFQAAPKLTNSPSRLGWEAFPSAEEMAVARKILRPWLEKISRQSATDLRTRTITVVDDLFSTVKRIAFWLALPSLLLALVARESLVLRRFDVAVVDRHGMPASRVRFVLRTAIVWLPLIGMGFVHHFLAKDDMHNLPTMALALSALLPILFLVGAIYSVARPERGLQDRLAGTWLVPR